MKTNLYLSVACVATLLFASCSKEAEPTPEPIKGIAKVELSLKGSSVAQSRITGTLPVKEEDESNINTLAVGVFVGENVNVIKEFSSSDLKEGKYSFECKPGVCDIVVIANAPAGTFTPALTTKAAFLALTVALSQTATDPAAGTAPQLSTNLPMSGENKGVTLNSGGEKTDVSVVVSRLVSRLSVSSIKTEFSPAYKDATFTLKKVFLYNAMSTSTVAIGTPETSAPVSGILPANKAAYLCNELTTGTAIGTTPYTDAHWFYTFANEAATPTKLVLYGSFDADGSGSAYAATDTYYPVKILKEQDGSAFGVARGKAYAITAKITGIGVEDPSKDITPASLSLTVTVAGWGVTITQNVDF